MCRLFSVFSKKKLKSSSSTGSHEEESTTADYERETATPDYDYNATFDYYYGRRDWSVQPGAPPPPPAGIGCPSPLDLTGAEPQTW
ncbi:UPF0303 protein [Dissostichus eleginoides]|uniref:UPF0303 protein n=1 Tax=Dissostichus eleginoides TaxID=100907 RepID=A0AAD9C6A5_DISEL|nr:UPF0303 protein [Dissostichus eleginoides]